MPAKIQPRTFSPTLLVGLGDLGAEIADLVAATITARSLLATPVVSHMGILDSGAITVRGAASRHSSCPGLDASQRPGSYSTNFRAIQEVEQDVLRLLTEELSRLRRHDVLADLADKGMDVGGEIHLYLCCPLCDSVGSALLLPLIGFIQTLLAGRLKGTLLRLDIIGFFPDLFEEFQRDELAYMRSYCCVQELDWIGDDPRLISASDRTPYNNVFLFSAKNEDGIEMSSFRDMAAMVGDVLSSILSGEIASDNSFSRALLRQVSDKRARYSSFGMIKLVLPVDEVMAGLWSYCTHRIIEGRASSGRKAFEKELVNSDAKDFILSNQLDALSGLMEVDAAGNKIEIGFRFDGEIREQLSTAQFVEQLTSQAQQFERTQRSVMDLRLVQRSRSLKEEVERSLLAKVYKSLDDRSLGPEYAASLLDLLCGVRSDRLTGALSGEPADVRVIEQDAKRFFDEILEVDRDGLARVEEDLADKRALLATWSEEDSTEPAEDTDDLGVGDVDGERPATGTEEHGGLDLDRVTELRDEIETLQGEKAALGQAVTTCDTLVADPSKRRQLREGQEAELQEQREGLVEEAEEVADRLALGIAERDRSRDTLRAQVLKWGAAVPLIALGVLALATQVLASLISAFSPWQTLWAWSWVLGFFLLMYAGWAVFRVRTQGWRPYQTAVSEVLDLRAKRKGAFRAIEASFVAEAHLRLMHSLNGLLVDWVRDLKRSFDALRASTNSFAAALESEAQRHSALFASLEFRNTPFCRSVLGRPEVERLIENSPRLDIERRAFFQETPLSRFFREFRAQRTLDALLAATRAFTESVFPRIAEASVEDFLQNEEGASQALSPRLNSLYSSVKASILLDVEKGMDVSEGMVFVGVENEATSLALEALRRGDDGSLEPYSTRRKSEIAITRLKIGFPAFHMAHIGYGRSLLMRANDPRAFNVEPDWVPDELVPSAFTIGGEGDEVRRLATLARAWGLVKSESDEFSFETQFLGDSFEEFVDALRSFKGREVRRRITVLLDEEKLKADAVERLVVFRDSTSLDQVDRRIIEESIMEISPLA